MIALATFFLLGVLFGSHVLSQQQSGEMTNAKFWYELGWGPSLGIASSFLMIFSFPRVWEQTLNKRVNWMEWIMAGLGLLGFILLVVHQYGVL